MKNNVKWLLALVSLAYVIQTCESMNIVCYYTNWSQYRNGPGKYFPENMDPNLCTHIIYSFGKIEGGILASFEWNDLSTEWSKGLYARTMALRSQNPKLKILLAVGGWNAGSAVFSNMVATPTSRKIFIDSALKFIVDNGFDGLDMDWEYPANRDSEVKEDRERFTIFLSELRAVFGPKNLLITAALGAGKATIDSAYEVAKISEHLDFINLMTYDLHGAWDSTTDVNAPLYHRETDADKTLNVAWASEYMVKLGAPKSKLMIGLATYGRAFTLASASQTGIGAPAKGAALQGKYTGEPGFLAYYEICQNLQAGWTRVYDDVVKSPYAYSGTQWVGYDDIQSLTEKTKYILANGYGGVMFWTFDLDDFSGTFCNQGKFPLMNAVKALVTGQAPVVVPTTAQPVTQPTTQATTQPATTQPTTQPTIQTSTQPATQATTQPATTQASTTAAPTTQPAQTTTQAATTVPTTASTTTTTTQAPTTTTAAPAPKVGDVRCPNGDGYYADVSSGCSKYFQCVDVGKPTQQVHTQSCPPGLIFDGALRVCNYPAAVKC